MVLQAGFEEKLASHKQLIDTKMGPVITLVKVLQITDSKAFVTTYSQLLEQRYQTPDAMQQLLTLLDISKDVAVARVNMFRALGNSGGLAAVRSHISSLLKSKKSTRNSTYSSLVLAEAPSEAFALQNRSY